MSLDLNKRLEWFDSPEGKQMVKEHLERINNAKNIYNSQLERFHEKYSHRLDEIMKKIIRKYESESYRKRWYSYSEPPEDLFWFMNSYAEKYGREGTKIEYEKYGNMFTGEINIIGKWVFNIMHGQGTVIQVYEMENVTENLRNIEEECIGDLKKQFIRPTLEEQRKVHFSISEVLGNISLAFYRGIDYGKTLKDK